MPVDPRWYRDFAVQRRPLSRAPADLKKSCPHEEGGGPRFAEGRPVHFAAASTVRLSERVMETATAPNCFEDR
jgi:hypothetical protein